MPSNFLITLLLAAVVSASIAAVVAYFASVSVRKFVCRTAVILQHIHPLSWDSESFRERWKKENFRRETFFSAWFLAFVLLLVLVIFFQ